MQIPQFAKQASPQPVLFLLPQSLFQHSSSTKILKAPLLAHTLTLLLTHHFSTLPAWHAHPQFPLN